MVPVLFAMSWIGWCLLLVGIYLVVLLIRGAIHLGSWFIDEFVVAPREEEELATKRRNRSRESRAVDDEVSVR